MPRFEGNTLYRRGAAADTSDPNAVAMRRLSIALALAALAGLAACDSGTPSPDAPTLTEVQAAILTPTCATSNCHAGPSPSAGLDLSAGASHAALVDQPSGQKPNTTLVVPGDPARSYVLDKVEGAPDIAGQRMPISAPLTSSQIDQLRRWIEAGARNN